MDGFDQRGHAFRRGELRNSVAEIENVAGIADTEAVEYFPGFAGDDFRRGEQDVRVEVAL